MKQEEYLDRLIEGQDHRGSWQLVNNNEIAACLAAAERLARLEEIDVPTDFAARLEQSVRARARSYSLHHQNENGGTLSNEKVISVAPHRTPKRRASTVLLGTAAVLVLAFVSLLAFSARSLPGNPSSGPKQITSQWTPTFANTAQVRARSDIALLQSALSNLRTVVNDQSGDNALTLALKTVAARTNDCRDAVAALPAGSEREMAQQDLNGVLAQEEQTVRQSLNQVDWPMRLLFTQQLGVLGDPVPTVIHATAHAQLNGTLLITLVGTHFALGAKFMLNGQPKGAVSQVTPGQLVAIIRSSQWLPGSHALGILNPDGTAAQFVLGEGDDKGE